nr:hypothetical protein HK105_001658 [Polyrhizophydium stewartii]
MDEAVVFEDSPFAEYLSTFGFADEAADAVRPASDDGDEADEAQSNGSLLEDPETHVETSGSREAGEGGGGRGGEALVGSLAADCRRTLQALVVQQLHILHGRHSGPDSAGVAAPGPGMHRSSALLARPAALGGLALSAVCSASAVAVSSRLGWAVSGYIAVASAAMAAWCTRIVQVSAVADHTPGIVQLTRRLAAARVASRSSGTKHSSIALADRRADGTSNQIGASHAAVDPRDRDCRARLQAVSWMLGHLIVLGLSPCSNSSPGIQRRSRWRRGCPHRRGRQDAPPPARAVCVASRDGYRVQLRMDAARIASAVWPAARSHQNGDPGRHARASRPAVDPGAQSASRALVRGTPGTV